MYNQEWVWIPREGLWNYSSRFLWIMSWGALIALLVQYKCERTNYIKHISMSKNNNVRYKEMRVERKDPNANKRIYFEARATALHPRFHTEGFQLSTIGSSTKGPPPRNYKYKSEYTTPTLITLHERKTQCLSIK